MELAAGGQDVLAPWAADGHGHVGVGEYPRERASAHAAAVRRALGADPRLPADLRNLAPELSGWEG